MNITTGGHLDRVMIRTAKEVDIFQLFFTDELIANIWHTNTCAWANITKKVFICRSKWSMDWSYACWKEKVYFLAHLWGYSKCSCVFTLHEREKLFFWMVFIHLSQKLNTERAFYVPIYICYMEGLYISSLLSFNVTQCNIETQCTWDIN